MTVQQKTASETIVTTHLNSLTLADLAQAKTEVRAVAFPQPGIYLHNL